MSLVDYLKNNLGMAYEKASKLAMSIYRYKKLRENSYTFSDKEINLYLNMDGVITDIHTLQLDCLRENINLVYPDKPDSTKKLHSIEKYKVLSLLIEDISKGTTLSNFSQSAIDYYINNIDNPDKNRKKTNIESIMERFNSILVRNKYYLKAKILRSFNPLAKQLNDLKIKYPNLKIYIVSYLHFLNSNLELSQKIEWLESNKSKLNLVFDGNTFFSKKNLKSLVSNSESILIDYDINDCLSFEENGGYSILYNENIKSTMDKLNTIIEHNILKKTITNKV